MDNRIRMFACSHPPCGSTRILIYSTVRSLPQIKFEPRNRYPSQSINSINFFYLRLRNIKYKIANTNTIAIFAISRSRNRCLKKRKSTATTVATISTTCNIRVAFLPILTIYKPYAQDSRTEHQARNRCQK